MLFACRVYFWHKPSTQWENLKRAKSVSTLGSTSPGSSLLISSGTGAQIIRFETRQDSPVFCCTLTARAPRALLVFREPAERNANATLAKSFHIYEAHTCGRRCPWVSWGGGDRMELWVIQSAGDEGRGSHCVAKGVDSISAATRGPLHTSSASCDASGAERGDRSRRTPRLSHRHYPRDWRTAVLEADWGNVRRHENQTRRIPPAAKGCG